MKINRFTLQNGLRVVHQHDTSTAMVAANLLYNVGARDEVDRTRGMAHLFEHMMFTGTPGVPDFDATLQDVGAMNNAWTSNDFTNFYEYGPASALETMLMVESDRMRGLSLEKKSFENQRSVVIEEFKQTCLNRPYGDLQHHLRPMVYGKGHHYSVPVIGSTVQVLEGVTVKDLRHWQSKYYVPANAILAVCGNVDLDTVRTLVERYFADIPSGEAAVHHISAELCSAVRGGETITVHGLVPQPLVSMVWLMDEYGTRDYYAADCLSDVLSDGRSSRFYRDIMMHNDSVADADASISGSEDKGMFIVTARVEQDDDNVIAGVADLLVACLRSVGGDAPVTDRELQRAKNKYRSRHLFSNLDCASRATTLATAELHGENYDTQVERYSSLTVDAVNDAARRLFAPPPAIVVYRP